MRLTSFLLFICVFCTMAENVHSQNARVNINKNNARLDEVLTEIESQTDYLFVYNNEVNTSTRVSVKAKDKPVRDVLATLFDESNVRYTMEGNHIILAHAASTAIPVVQQDQRRISGIVTDELGEPLVGVNVAIKAGGGGTITDLDGKYSLPVPNGATLEFSYLGFVKTAVAVGNQTTINVTLQEDTQALDEVVVVGYGTMKKKDLTGSVASVDGDALTSRKTTQLSQSLQGSLPGVMVTRDSSSPGAGATIKVRGVTTIGDSNPLVIVDGMPVGGIDDVNANDVETISVLKDAASASIYGARAAAGVILITTKRAKAEQFSLDYNFEYGLEVPTSTPDFVDAIRYMQMANELRWNDAGNGTNEYPTYTKEHIDNYLTNNKSNPDVYPITDWQSMIMKSNAPRQTHVLKFSGGSQKVRTNASFIYDKTNALYDGSQYQRITSRINNDLIINKYLKAYLDIDFKRTDMEEASESPWYYMRISAPIYAATWSDGRIAEGKTGANIYGQIKEGGYKNTWTNNLRGRIGLDLTPVDGLKLSAVFSPNFYNFKKKDWRKAVPYTAWDDPTVVSGYLQWGKETKLSESRNDSYGYTTQLLANYNKTFGDHSIDLLGGYESSYTFWEDLGASRGQYDLDSYPYLNLGPLELRDNNGKAYELAYMSYFGRAMYNYKNRYLLQGNIRYDASSRFAPDSRWGAFPSVSAGWVTSEEAFFPKNDVLTFFKLRGSWGTLGNERTGAYDSEGRWVPNYYPYQATIAFSNALFYQGNNIVSEQSAAQQRYVISNITWETTETYDIGFDANFFNDRLRVSADYFKKMTKDMLLALQIPTYMGFDNPDQNTGKMDTKGWEIQLSWNDKIGEVGYSAGFNLFDSKTKMGDLGGTQFLGDQIKIEGSEFNEWYGYKAIGIYQTQEQVDNSAKTSASVKVGDLQYMDISGPDGVPDGKISPEYDRVLLGGSLPRYNYGGYINLDYKGVDFGLVFQGVGKQNVREYAEMFRPLMENWGSIPSILDGNYYSQYNTTEQNAHVRYPRLTSTNAGNNYDNMSDHYLFSGSYFRLKNISLGYTLPKSWVNRIAMQNLRVYVTMSDIFCIDNYPKGWDPETGNRAYPITTSYVFGLSVKF